MSRALLIGPALLLGATAAHAQIGGQSVFSSLNLPPTAKLAGVGGVSVSVRDNDPGMLFANPALLNADMDGRLALSYGGYLGGIKQSTAAYVRNSEKLGRWGFGLSYLSYGDFDMYDPAGNPMGQFSVNDYHLNISNAQTYGNFTMGATARFAVAGIAGEHSMALLTDVGSVFKHPEKDFTVGLAVKNLGYQIKPFPGSDREPLPLDVQIGTTIKPEHMPVRFSITAHHLQQFDIVYLDTLQRRNQSLDGNAKAPKKTIGDQIARHFVIGGELMLGKSLNLRVAYNHLRRRELRLDNTSGGAGLSFGAMLRLGAYQFEYTRALYHGSGGANYITLARNVHEMFGKKN
ncbi:type IX secretion system protein PorQ [Hymenobacter sp. CRA2]|uniref:type IX secretion system protein PorQ n=1 Tax=Hymenobacter sp. CRA2 TaxID=1955620 RepID=UPI0020C9912D|nr:type IX secretion system protein PorQ [Hymenobacter sp. CRA2]